MPDLDSLHKEYDSVRDLASRFCRGLKQQLEELLSANEVTLGVPLESRVKSWHSIAEKTERLSLKLQSVKELNDLVGLRLILLFRRDVTKVCELVSKTFVVVSQEDTSQRLGETEFGYQSLHYVVRLPENWLSVPSFKGFDDFQAELQVRSLAQHIWAAASHVLQYKQAASVPLPVRRSIYRVSALLETVDLEFERVLEERQSYVSEWASDRPLEPINVDLLTKILDTYLPAENKKQPEPYSELIPDLNHFGIDNAEKLTELIKNQLRAALENDAKRVRKERDYLHQHGRPPLSDKDRIKRGVFYAHVGLVRDMLAIQFGDQWRSYSLSKLKPKQ